MIRCKDCKFRNHDGYCTRLHWTMTVLGANLWKVSDMDYCSVAELREEVITGTLEVKQGIYSLRREESK